MKIGMKHMLPAAMAVVMAATLQAATRDRFVRTCKLPSGHAVVVAEGDFEARSIGSFSVRLYEPAAAPDETTFFLSGLIHSRDGTLEQIVLDDVTGDRRPEILVVSRSVGTGNFLSVYVFEYTDTMVRFRTAMEGLPPGTNIGEAVRAGSSEN